MVAQQVASRNKMSRMNIENLTRKPGPSSDLRKFTQAGHRARIEALVGQVSGWWGGRWDADSAGNQIVDMLNEVAIGNVRDGRRTRVGHQS